MDCHLDRPCGLLSTLCQSVTILAVLLLVDGAFVSNVANAQQPAITTPIVFDGVTVIDVQRGKHVPAQRVVLMGNRIRAMGDVGSVKLPSGAHVVDARGKYLIPGFWDMHTHSRLDTDVFYPLFIANGVTGIRDAWSEVPLDTLLLWRREILAGTRVGPPRQLLAGPAFDAAGSCDKEYRGSGHICVADSADARHVVDSLKAAGADFIKTYSLTREIYFVVASESRRVKIPFGGHLTSASAIEASDSGASILDHINSAGGMDTVCLVGSSSVERCKLVAERFQHNGTWWVPTLIRSSNVGDFRPTTRSIRSRFYKFASEFWSGSVQHRDWLHDSTNIDNTRSPNGGLTADSNGLLSIMHRVGLPILAGTDAGAPVMSQKPPGFSIHTELAIYVTEGLTPLEALQSATLNPAKYLHGTDSLGTVAPGKMADLVLLDADPLEDITNTSTIRAVVANGRYFDRAALDKLLVDVQAKAKQQPRPLTR